MSTNNGSWSILRINPNRTGGSDFSRLPLNRVCCIAPAVRICAFGDSRVCAIGSQQSPVDIGETVKAQLPPLKIAWTTRADTVVNNGHTIQVNCGDGSTLIGPSGSYRLVQFHFHHPSEHLIGGKSFAMEAHFVHANATGGLAVVGVLIATGKPNPVFSKIVSTMPTSAGAPVKVDPAIDPNAMLPAKRGYYRYSGSLTSPPCSEVVDWLLLSDPIQVAEADVARFATLYPLNARPAQRTDRRFVLRSG
jgi:carbonic anhydrase